MKLKLDRHSRQLLLSLLIALAVIGATGFALVLGSGFDLRAHAKKVKTEGEVKKELRKKKDDEDCSSSGGQWIGTGSRGKGYCRPMTEKEVKKAQSGPLNTTPSPGAGGTEATTPAPQGNGVPDAIRANGWPIAIPQ